MSETHYQPTATDHSSGTVPQADSTLRKKAATLLLDRTTRRNGLRLITIGIPGALALTAFIQGQDALQAAIIIALVICIPVVFEVIWEISDRVGTIDDVRKELVGKIDDVGTAVTKCSKPLLLIDPYPTKQDVQSAIERFIRNAVTSRTYLGFFDYELVRWMSEQREARPEKHQLYVHPLVLKRMLDQSISPIGAFVTDCPRESCTVFITGAASSCITVRHLPDGGSWALQVQTEDYADYLDKTYNRRYHKNNCALVDSYFKALFIARVFLMRRDKDKDICRRDKEITYAFRHIEYQFAGDFIAKAKQSIYALDFTSPVIWNKLSVMTEYLAAHKFVDKFPRIRIHIYDPEMLSANIDTMNKAQTSLSEIEAYEAYFVDQDDHGMELRFLPKSTVQGERVTGGFVVADNSVVVYAKGLEPMEEYSGVCFKREGIDVYTDTFTTLKKRAQPLGAFEEALSQRKVVLKAIKRRLEQKEQPYKNAVE